MVLRVSNLHVILIFLSPLADCSTFRVDTAVIKQRVPILLKYLDSDTEKELQALYALQASIVKLDQPASKFTLYYLMGGESYQGQDFRDDWRF